MDNQLDNLLCIYMIHLIPRYDGDVENPRGGGKRCYSSKIKLIKDCYKRRLV